MVESHGENHSNSPRPNGEPLSGSSPTASPLPSCSPGENRPIHPGTTPTDATSALPPPQPQDPTILPKPHAETGSRVRLLIGPIVEQALFVQNRVHTELPTHPGLARLAGATANAAREAETVSQRLQSIWGVHRLPALFLGVALIILGGWIYMEFFQHTTLRIALPERDAQMLQERAMTDRRLNISLVLVPGSREASEMVARGEVDLAFVQGGISIAPELPRMQVPRPETLIVMSRFDGETTLLEELNRGNNVVVITSNENAGSHSVAQQIFSDTLGLGEQIDYRHDWRELCNNPKYDIPPGEIAVVVVKDLRDNLNLKAIQRLRENGFRVDEFDLGLKADRLSYLSPITLRRGVLGLRSVTPEDDVTTYAVSTFLVGRKGLTKRMLALAAKLIEPGPELLTPSRLETSFDDASELFQGVDAFFGILINIGLAFLALLGWEMFAYRRQFHELNSLISLISVHQSSKDVLGVTDRTIRQENLTYLSLSSDLLGLISMIAGYYTQENSSLLFNRMPEIIHQRCDGLKINIQLKILHATIGEN